MGRTASERTNNADILQLLRSYTGTAQPRHAHEPPPRQGTDNGANNTRESNDSDISDSGSTSSQADDDVMPLAHFLSLHRKSYNRQFLVKIGVYELRSLFFLSRKKQHKCKLATGNIFYSECSGIGDKVHVRWQRWDIADQSEFYQTQWALFASNKDADRQFSYSDVPWPGASMSPSAIVEVILHGTQVQTLPSHSSLHLHFQDLILSKLIDTFMECLAQSVGHHRLIATMQGSLFPHCIKFDFCFSCTSLIACKAHWRFCMASLPLHTRAACLRG